MKLYFPEETHQFLFPQSSSRAWIRWSNSGGVLWPACRMDFKRVTLSQLPCHLLEGSNHVCIVDGLIMKCIWWSNLIMRASQPRSSGMEESTAHGRIACSGRCYCLDFSDLHRSQLPLQYPSPDWITEEAHVLCDLALRGSACACVWQDDFICQGLPLLVREEQNNLAKRDARIRMHSCTRAFR